MKIYTFFIALILSITINAQNPKTALIQSSTPYIFSGEGINFYTANLTFSFYDSLSRPVPQGTKIGIFYKYADLVSNSLLYKNIDTSDYWGEFYFETDANGQISIDYLPHYIPTYSKANASNLTEYEQFYDVRNLIKDNIYKAKYYNGTDLGMDWNNPITILDNSDKAVIVGADSVKLVPTGRSGDEYVFACPGQKNPESINIQLQFFDQYGNPIPEDIPLVMFTPYDGDNDYSSPNVFATIYGKEYYFKSGSNGIVNFKFIPTLLQGYSTGYFYYGPWSDYKKQIGNLYQNEDEAWAQFLKDRTPNLSFAAVPYWANGTPIFNGYFSWYFPNRANYLRIGGKKPVVIGPDVMTVNTKGIIHNDKYLFTNRGIVEPATVEITQYDEIGRTVPGGTPIELVTTYNYLDNYAGNGFIVGKNIETATGNAMYYAYTDNSGFVKFVYTPPFASPTAMREYACLLLNTPIKGINWLYPELPVMTDGSTVPMLVGIVHSIQNANDNAHATIQFVPQSLQPGKIAAKVRIQVFDQMNRPALKGTQIRVYVDKGYLEGNNTFIERTLGKNGKITIFYLSPTRNIGYDGDVTLTVSGYANDNYYHFGGEWLDINSASMHMSGAAYNPIDGSLTKLLFGKTFRDVLSDLNPFKALGSMKNLSKAAELARQKRKELYRIAGDPNSTDLQLRQAEQEFQDAFKNVTANIAEFVKDVPGTSFNPNLPQSGFGLYQSLVQNGIRKHFINSITETLTKEQVKQATIRYIETKLHTKIFPQTISGNADFAISNSDERNTQSVTGSFNVKFDGPFYAHDGETGLHELLGLKIRISDIGNINYSSLNVGDQDLLPPNFVPDEIGQFIAGGGNFESVGFFEITNIDSNSGTIEFVANTEIFPSITSYPEIAVSKRITDTTNTAISWLDGSNILFSPNSVNDSATVFLTSIPTPKPVNEVDSIKMITALAFGSVDKDSNIVPLNLLSNAKFNFDLSEQYLDSIDVNKIIPFKYDTNTNRWIPLTPYSFSNQQIQFEISNTGIYGLGYNPGYFISGVKNDEIVTNFRLRQNYPNPFNPTTTIEYVIPERSEVNIILYDALGRRVKTLLNSVLEPGVHKLILDAKNLSSGIYYYQLFAGKYKDTKKMVLLK